jgi:hypothetical protein
VTFAEAVEILDRCERIRGDEVAYAVDVQLERLAEDVRRLRRHVDEAESSLAHLVDRMAFCVDVLDAIVRPTAGELCRWGITPAAAVELVDRRAARMRSLLGITS